MNCVLCGKASLDARIDQFPLSAEAREMLKKQLAINPDEAFAIHALCRTCLALPVAERYQLAQKAIEAEQDETRRDLNQRCSQEKQEWKLGHLRSRALQICDGRGEWRSKSYTIIEIVQITIVRERV